MYQMFNFKDACAFTEDLLSTFSNLGIEDLCHTEVDHATQQIDSDVESEVSRRLI